MIDRSHELPLTRQCEIVLVSRSSQYTTPKPVSAQELHLLRRLDELHLKCPFFGSRRLRRALRDEGIFIGRRRVQTLMRKLGIAALYPRPRLSQPGPGHRIYPYLLRNLTIDRPNQVWATDITYIPMPRGFLYLVVIMDWYSRKALSWRLSNTLDAGFCVEALEEALAVYGAPEIFNSDQGSQFTSEAFTSVLKEHEVRISMDGRGRWVDNVFVERLWWSLKYEEVYLRAYETPAEARRGIGNWLAFYNTERPHQALGYQTPDAMYAGTSLAA